MIKYRPHRTLLADAMEEAKEFNTIDELKDYVYQCWNNALPGCFDKDDIVIGEIYGDDDRVGWKNLRDVCVKRFKDEIDKVPRCIGTCGEEQT